MQRRSIRSMQSRRMQSRNISSMQSRSMQSMQYRSVQSMQSRNIQSMQSRRMQNRSIQSRNILSMHCPWEPLHGLPSNNIVLYSRPRIYHAQNRKVLMLRCDLFLDDDQYKRGHRINWTDIEVSNELDKGTRTMGVIHSYQSVKK